MYREFRELEAKIAAISAASKVVPAEVDSPSGTPGDSTAMFGKAEGGSSTNLPDIKNERDAKKRDIKQWIKEFEEREGHPPSTK